MVGLICMVSTRPMINEVSATSGSDRLPILKHWFKNSAHSYLGLIPIEKNLPPNAAIAPVSFTKL